MVDKRLGWTRAQKKRRTVKKQSERREYGALIVLHWGEVGHKKKVGEKKQSEK